MVSTVTSQHGGLGLRCFCVGVVGSADAVQRHAVRFVGDSKGRLCLCASPATGCRSVQGVPCLEPCDSWDRLQPPSTLKLDKQKWMNGSGHGL